MPSYLSEKPHFTFEYSEEIQMTRRWTCQEDSQLIHLVNLYGRNWKQIAKIIRTKSAPQCIYRHDKLLKILDHSIWTIEQDIQVFCLINQFGLDFEKISQNISCRIPYEVEHRYNSYLKNITVDNLSENEEFLLNNFVEENNKSWEEIATYFPQKHNPLLLKKKAESLVSPGELTKKKVSKQINDCLIYFDKNKELILGSLERDEESRLIEKITKIRQLIQDSADTA